jgi:phosphatidate phosphatase APP1
MVHSLHFSMNRLHDATMRRQRPLTKLGPDEQIVLFPSLAYKSPGGDEWIVDVHGDVFAVAPMGLGKRVLLRLLKRAMRATADDLATPLFQERIARFTAQNLAGKRIAVRVGAEHVALTKSRRNGHFQLPVRISASEAREWAESERPHWEPYLPVEVPGADANSRAYLVEPTGLSVISDIDDTLKHSHVACKRTLLTNTFLRPFETIPGMAAQFRQWAGFGTAFHYVSSSPWQLYVHLAEHLAHEGFPAGSFHLRPFRLRDHLLRRMLLLRRTGKQHVIRNLLNAFPKRRFLLIGDSGEHDPEIYGSIARRFPQQVVGIFIRQLAGERNTKRRYAKAFRRIDPTLLRLFADAAELSDVQVIA